jgi:hypothetical protein
VACVTVQNIYAAESLDYADPILQRIKSRTGMRCDDGVYFRIPRRFIPRIYPRVYVYGTWLFDRRQDRSYGDVVVAVKGNAHDRSHERWSATGEAALKKRIKYGVGKYPD